jgi:hypothetical protein
MHVKFYGFERLDSAGSCSSATTTTIVTTTTTTTATHNDK